MGHAKMGDALHKSGNRGHLRLKPILRRGALLSLCDVRVGSDSDLHITSSISRLPMKMLRFFFALVCSTVLAAPVAAFDLTRIDRKIVREPAYQSKAKYCLLAVGPEAKTRVWLVLDGDVLYVDRNGNADLTTAKKVRATAATEKGQYTFLCGAIRDGEFTHQNLTVHVEKRRGYSVSMDVETPGHKGTGIGGGIVQFVFSDAKGPLQFADHAKDAPVIHFGGPWQVAPLGGQRLAVGGETH